MDFDDFSTRLPGEICGVDNCMSSLWTDNGDGTMSCENGHVRAGFADADDEPEGDYDPAERGTTTRRKREKETRESLVYKGRQQKNLFALCFQLVLRKQLYFLINGKSLPPELEEIVRELWEQRMNKFVGAIDDTFSQTFSSLNDTEETKNRTSIRLNETPRMVESIALCFLGTHLLRIPLFLGDFLRWIKTGELVYVNAASHLPNDMRIRLNVTVYWALNTPLAPSLEYLRNAVHATIRAYTEEFGMILPPLNLSLCLYRLVEELCVPLEVYSTTKKLIQLFGVTFEFPRNWYKAIKNKEQSFSVAPDRRLAALFVVAVKLLYPFDMKPRHPTTLGEPTVAVVDWVLWKKLQEQKTTQKKKSSDPPYISYEDAAKVTEQEMLLMKDEQIDQYMDWLADTMALPKEDGMIRKNEFARELFNMFPIEKSNDTDARITSSHRSNKSDFEQNELERVQNGLILRKVIPNDTLVRSTEVIWRPGQAYKRYYKVEDLEKDEVAKHFFNAVAEFIGLSLGDLTDAVHTLEMQMYKWMVADRKLKREQEIEMD